MPRRIVLSFLSLAALAGYVAAQNAESPSGAFGPVTAPGAVADEGRQAGGGSNVRLYWRPNAEASFAPPALGRYQLSASGERMLDTATGTLYAVSGQSWVAIASLPEGPPAAAATAPAPAGGADRRRGRARLVEVRQQFLASLAAAEAKRDAATNQPEAERQELEARVRTLQTLVQQIDKALGIVPQPGLDTAQPPGLDQGE